MKIRTFLTCEEVSVETETKKVTITNMYGGLYPETFPFKKDVVVILTFDEVEKKEKKLDIALFSKNDKPLQEWSKSLRELQNGVTAKLNEAIFEEPGLYHLKISYDGHFLGKYGLRIHNTSKEGVN